MGQKFACKLTSNSRAPYSALVKSNRKLALENIRSVNGRPKSG